MAHRHGWQQCGLKPVDDVSTTIVYALKLAAVLEGHRPLKFPDGAAKAHSFIPLHFGAGSG